MKTKRYTPPERPRLRLVETLPASRDSGPDEVVERYDDPDSYDHHDDASDHSGYDYE